MRLLIWAALLSLFAIAAAGQVPGNPDNWCREGLFTTGITKLEIGVVRGSAGKRAYFYDDSSDKCPENASCQTKAYVIPGDKVVVSHRRGDFACSWFSPVKKGSPRVGWLRAGDLVVSTEKDDVSERAWLGEWDYALNSIKITPNKLAGFLNISGTALWKGLGDNVHIGELDGRFPHKNGVIEYSDGDDEFDCRATLRLKGGFLLVADNMKCGGANVTFSGIYRRTKKY